VAAPQVQACCRTYPFTRILLLLTLLRYRAQQALLAVEQEPVPLLAQLVLLAP
jgi:hypothetical protein